MLGLIYEAITILILLTAGISGLYVLRKRLKQIANFKLGGMVNRQKSASQNNNLITGIWYIIVMLTTAGSFLAAFLRATWLSEVGWDAVGTEWKSWWLTSHSIDGICAVLLHFLVYAKFTDDGE